MLKIYRNVCKKCGIHREGPEGMKCPKCGRPMISKTLERIEVELPKLSFIILSWYNHHLTKICVRSITTYCKFPYEVLILDQGTPSPILDQLENPHVKIHHIERNIGVAAGRNLLARKATGEILIFLDNKIELLPRCIENLVAALSIHRVGAAHGLFLKSLEPKIVEFFEVEVGEDLEPYQKILMEEMPKVPIEIVPVKACTGGLLAIRRDLFRKIGEFDERFFYGREDSDLSFRLREAGYWCVAVNAPCIIHRNLLSYPPSAQTLKSRSWITSTILFKQKWHRHKYLIESFHPKLPGDLKLLSIIDTYGWAYDTSVTGLYKTLGRLQPSWTLVKATVREVVDRQIDPREHDVILVWAWYGKIAHQTKLVAIRKLLELLPPERSILKVCAEENLEILHTLANDISTFPYIAGKNPKITETLRRTFPDKIVFQLDSATDVEKFYPAPLPKDFVVGWVGNVDRPLKRFHLAEQACREAGVPLKVAGHIYSDQYIPHEKMVDFYHSISVLLITSCSEAHPLVAYEAMACGRPLIATLVGDLDSVAKNGVNGIYLPVNCTVEQIKEAILTLKNDRKLLEKMSRAARRSVVRRWRWSKVVTQYLDAIKLVYHNVYKYWRLPQ